VFFFCDNNNYLLIMLTSSSASPVCYCCVNVNIVNTASCAAMLVEASCTVVMLRFPNFDFRSISIRFLAQNDDFDSIQF